MTNLEVIEGGEGKPILTEEEQAYFDRSLFIQGLIDLANFLEEHPTLPLPEATLNVFDFGKMVESEETAKEIAKALRIFQKKESTGLLTLIKTFGPIQLHFVFTRSSVCERIVVGTRRVVKEVPIGAVHYETKTVEEDIVEWKCPSLLKGTEDD